jgi:beta-lactamase class A
MRVDCFSMAASYAHAASQRRRHEKHNRIFLWITIGVVILLSVIFVWYHVQTPSKPKVAFTALTLEKNLEAIRQKYPDITIGVGVIDPSSHTIASVNGLTAFRAASTTKLFTATLFLHQVEMQQQSLSQLLGIYPAQFQLQSLINQSNNDSWILFRQLLGHATEENYIHDLGIASYQLEANTITANDLATFLAQLDSEKILNKSDTQLLYSYMQHTYEERFVAPFIPNNFDVYHKSGTLDDDVHEAIILHHGSTRVVAAIMTNGQGSQDYDARQNIFRDIIAAIISQLHL